MNWISNVVRPKIRSILSRRDVPDNLWIKCPDTGQLVFYKDVEANGFVIPGSNYHMRMGAVARLKSMFDGSTWLDIAVTEMSHDPLKFRDERRSAARFERAQRIFRYCRSRRPLAGAVWRSGKGNYQSTLHELPSGRRSTSSGR